MVHVGVVGAGPAGLCAAHNALQKGHQVTIWEQCDQVGGTWVYSPEVGIHSSMYEVMKTNLPKEGMSYPDVPFDTTLPSFLDHQDVLKYLQNYCKNIPIELNTKVIAVDRKENLWEVKVQKKAAEEKVIEVDALFVCNGHFSEPNRPFDESKFKKGTIIHSHDYRNNRKYAGSKVVMIGHGFSGIDIGCQIAEVAEKVYLVGHCINPYNGFPENLILVEHDAIEITEDGVKTNKGVIECDHIIISTGYFYSYPFFPKTIVWVEEDGRVVRPLYLHFIHRQYSTSLFFIGLNFIVVPFILFHAQVEYAMALIEGRCEVPSVEEMDKWEEKRLEWLAKGDQPIRRYHMMGNYQWEYFDELCRRAQSASPFYTPLVRKLFDYTFNARRANVLKYKDVNFRVDGDEYQIIDE